MSTSNCPELEALFTGIAEGDQALLAHAKDCPDCSLILEEHRQLEKDLFRVVDPLPPPNFTMAVMAKVAAAPVPVSSEIRSGVAVLILSLGSFFALLFMNGRSLADAGAGLARMILGTRTFFIAAAKALEAVWGTAAVPFVAVCFLVLLTSLLGLRRLVAAPQSA